MAGGPARRLTIVHVSTQATWHGGEGQAHHLARGLRARGHRIVLFARSGGDFARRGHQDGFDVREFRRRGRGPDSLWALRSWLKEVRPDVIHSHDGHALTASGLASLGLDIPVRIASRRVDFPIGSTAKFTRLADCVIAISSAVADICEQAGIPRSRIRIVPSGVDPARAASGDRERGRRALSLSDEDRLLLTVAKLTDHKGHRTLLNAMPEVLSTHPRVRLALAGEGELRATLERQVATLGLSKHVFFLGHRDDIPDLLHAADLFVMPSHMEGLCTSLLDAIFARCPIVTTGAGGIADIVDAQGPDGPVTFTTTPRDAKSMARSIRHALDAPEESARLVERAHHRASGHFTDATMVEGTLAVYQEALARATGRTALSDVA